MVDKVVRDGKVAVLVSYGFGAGWSTWVNSEAREKSTFDPEIVQWVEEGKPALTDEQKEKWSAAYGYLGGLRDLEVVWVSEGTAFRIGEYDGSEGLEFSDEVDWITA